MGAWSEIDHTADLAIEAEAISAEELFSTMCRALTSLICDPETVAPQSEVIITSHGFDLMETTVSAFSEILYWINQKNWLFSEFDCRKFSETAIELSCLGEPRDPARHVFNAEIKAATYHDFEFGTNDNGKWSAKVIFDV